MCYTRKLGNSREVSKALQFIVSRDKDKGHYLDLSLK